MCERLVGPIYRAVEELRECILAFAMTVIQNAVFDPKSGLHGECSAPPRLPALTLSCSFARAGLLNNDAGEE